MKDKYLIIVNKDRDADGVFAKRASECFEKLNQKYTFEAQPPFEEINAAVVLGGDGTLMRAADILKCYDIPLLGINIGTLGYLTGAEGSETESAIESLVNGRYTVEKRMMLDVSVNGGEAKAFLNDAVITRSGYSRIIKLGLYVNDKLLYTVAGDGIILSTPTGSTGYNLSAGGMICVPEAELIMCMPICPHSVSARGFIASAGDKIEIEMLEGRNSDTDSAGITIDGSTFVPLEAGDRVCVRKSESITKLIKVNDSTFFDTLKSKLV